MLDRSEILPMVVERPSDYLIIAGLGNAATDAARLADGAASVYPLGGAMGAAVPMGLGLALAQPRRRVLVMTGDAEILMSLGSLATVAVQDPGNLSIICLDNEHNCLTGQQRSHTSYVTDLEKVAVGAGIRHTLTVDRPEAASEAAKLIQMDDHVSFVAIKVRVGDSPHYAHSLDAAVCRRRFRQDLLGVAD